MTQEEFEAINVGDKVEINTHKQTFTVVDEMFDGEILELEGPNGGEKSLVQNVNNPEHIAVQERGNTVGTLTEIDVQ
jgi:hypothetical protein